MLFSIIIPLYNNEQFVVECLESIKNQLFTDYEVLIIDDGSQENSLSLVQSFCEDDDRFTCYSQSNKGPYMARKKGIKNH